MMPSNLDNAESTLHTMLLSNKRLTVKGEAKVIKEAISKDMEYELGRLEIMTKHSDWVKLSEVQQIIRKER